MPMKAEYGKEPLRLLIRNGTSLRTSTTIDRDMPRRRSASLLGRPYGEVWIRTEGESVLVAGTAEEDNSCRRESP